MRRSPSSITPDLAAIVVAAMAAGCSRSEASRRAGVAPSTVGTWLARGKAGRQPYVELLIEPLRRRGVGWSGKQCATDLLLCHARHRRLTLPRRTWDALRELGADGATVVVAAVDRELQRRSMAPEAVEHVA